jgi:hypothetical protein
LNDEEVSSFLRMADVLIEWARKMRIASIYIGLDSLGLVILLIKQIFMGSFESCVRAIT